MRRRAKTDLLAFVLLPLALAVVGTWLLVEAPHLPLAGMGALVVSMQASVYVCGAERGFLSDSYVGRILAEHARMQALPDPRPNWTPWEDG